MANAKWIGLVAAIAIVAGAAWFTLGGGDPGTGAAPGGARGNGPRSVAVTLAIVGASPVRREIEAVGTSMARQAVDIVPSAGGRIVTLGFRPGDNVEAGATLAQLDDDIERADLVEAEARLDEAELSLARARTLSQSNTISQASLEQLSSARTAARAAVDRALRRFADRTVTAPFAGIVGLRQVEIGARVEQGTVITTLDDLTSVEIEFALAETVFGQVRPGLDITADSAAFPGRVFEGAVETIDSRIDPASRAFKVRASVPNDDLALPAGMFMHLTLTLAERRSLTVPEEAITVAEDEAFVFVARDGIAERRRVALGERMVGSVEVTDGLKDGETIVVRGVQSLRDGAQIRDIDAPPESSGAAARNGGAS